MTVNLDEVQADMDVYDSVGEKIGGVTSLDTDRASGVRYLRVGRIALIPMSGPSHLWIPESEIQECVMGKPVIVKGAKDDIMERFRDKPSVL